MPVENSPPPSPQRTRAMVQNSPIPSTARSEPMEDTSRFTEGEASASHPRTQPLVQNSPIPPPAVNEMSVTDLMLPDEADVPAQLMSHTGNEAPMSPAQRIQAHRMAAMDASESNARSLYIRICARMTTCLSGVNPKCRLFLPRPLPRPSTTAAPQRGTDRSPIPPYGVHSCTCCTYHDFM